MRGPRRSVICDGTAMCGLRDVRFEERGDESVERIKALMIP
jgi:hypothetical protein